jgi:hypothetical protein
MPEMDFVRAVLNLLGSNDLAIISPLQSYWEGLLPPCAISFVVLNGSLQECLVPYHHLQAQRLVPELPLVVMLEQFLQLVLEFLL